MEGQRRPVNMWLFLLTVVVLVIGVALVYDASYATAGQAKYTGGDSAYFAKRQALFAVIGLAALLVAMTIPYWKYRPWAFTCLALAVIGLGLVFVDGVGIEVNGAKRWIGIPGTPIQIQPSELAKLALILFLASYLSSKRRDIRHWQYGLLPALVPISIMAALIMAEPDMGTCIVMGVTGFVMLYMAGARKRHMAILFAGAFVLGILLIIMEPYRLARITSFRDPFADYHGSGYQVCRSLIALGSGGVTGVGGCESREKCFYLPAEHTDFILAVLGEEFGLVGTLAIAGLFLGFGILGFRIAMRTREQFAKLLAAGLSTMICGQAFLNMAVVTSFLPATGVPLPFISYGGSSLVLNLIGVGVLLGISRYPGLAKDYYDEARYNGGRHRRTRVSGYQHSRASSR